MHHFHFTLGPVQGFVAQARRTRDFWAGSFILSWLAAVAMRAVERQNGTILFPEPDSMFMKSLEGGGTGPKQGNVPNRFVARVGDAFAPQAVEDCVRSAWRALAKHVWDADLSCFGQGSRTRAIWDRQIDGFWDVQWARVDDAAASNTLDRMKNWRTHLAPAEPGVKCMMMDGWQELSGAERPGRRPDDPDGPEAFWTGVRKSGANGMATDLRDKEMLCAIAFVKRRFARHFVDFGATIADGLTLKGWSLPHGVPSVHYMAAAPWLAGLLKKTAECGLDDMMRDFHDAAYELSGGYGEWDSNIQCVREANGSRQWKALDGTVFFDAMLENSNLWEGRPDKAAGVLKALKRLRAAVDMEPVSPFYAVLLMDGDQLGIHMSAADKQEKITKALAKFTAKTHQVVQQNNGFLVYSGGDDVLALLPLEDALRCAAALRSWYLECFRGTEIPTSLSGAIEYAHIKMSLGKVLHDAHDLLDNVAKEARGRDAIACRVWKPGGLALEWAMPWPCALTADGEVVIDGLASKFRDGMKTEEGDMASKFFYRIRERFELLNPTEHASDRAVVDEQQACNLLAMEYLNSGLVRDKKLGMNYARSEVGPLVEQCRPVTRDQDEKDIAKWKRSERLEADGALLVRFLAHKGVER